MGLFLSDVQEIQQAARERRKPKRNFMIKEGQFTDTRLKKPKAIFQWPLAKYRLSNL
jgi:hypothetical protein